jgi:hypothetical protein
MVHYETATELVIVIESKRRRRDDEPTLPDDVTLPDVHEDGDDQEVPQCAHTST